MHDIYIFCHFMFFFFLLADLLQEAVYFYSISQGSELTVTFVQIAKKEESDDKTKTMSTAMKKMGMLIPDVILLYTSNREILELFLKKVLYSFLFSFSISLFFLFFSSLLVKQFLYLRVPAMNTSDTLRVFVTLDYNWLFLLLQKSCVNVEGYTWILQGQVC